MLLYCKAMKQRLTKQGKLPSRKPHKLDQFEECKSEQLVGQECYEKVTCFTFLQYPKSLNLHYIIS
jgi:hypothetical protein